MSRGPCSRWMFDMTAAACPISTPSRCIVCPVLAVAHWYVSGLGSSWPTVQHATFNWARLSAKWKGCCKWCSGKLWLGRQLAGTGCVWHVQLFLVWQQWPQLAVLEGFGYQIVPMAMSCNRQVICTPQDECTRKCKQAYPAIVAASATLLR
jgi:hypothetical protein